MDGDDLLVATDRSRMASLAVERDGSVTLSVVPNLRQCHLPGVQYAERSKAYLVSAHGDGSALAKTDGAPAGVGAAVLL